MTSSRILSGRRHKDILDSDKTTTTTPSAVCEAEHGLFETMGSRASDTNTTPPQGHTLTNSPGDPHIDFDLGANSVPATLGVQSSAHCWRRDGDTAANRLEAKRSESTPTLSATSKNERHSQLVILSPDPPTSPAQSPSQLKPSSQNHKSDNPKSMERLAQTHPVYKRLAEKIERNRSKSNPLPELDWKDVPRFREQKRRGR